MTRAYTINLQKLNCQPYTKYRPNETPGGTLYKVGKKGGTTPPGPDEKSGPFFHAQNQEVNVYAR